MSLIETIIEKFFQQHSIIFWVLILPFLCFLLVLLTVENVIYSLKQKVYNENK